MYASVTLTENGAAAITYALGKGKGHNGHAERNLLVTPINMLGHVDYAKQMRRNWRLARSNHKIQIVRIVCSFSDNELRPDNEADIYLANEIMKRFVEKQYPDRECLICLQADGVGEKLHGHILISDVSMTAHKACKNAQKHVSHVRRWLNEEAAKFIELDDGKTLSVKRTQTERAKQEKAERIRTENAGKTEDEIRAILIKEKAYSTREDLRFRIAVAAAQAKNEEEFFMKMKEAGVIVTRCESNHLNDYYNYHFKGCPIKTKRKTISSFKLGYAYTPESLELLWADKDKNFKKTKNTEVSGFVEWMTANGKSYMQFDENGKLISTDFELMEQLHNEYEASLRQPAEPQPDPDTNETENDDFIVMPTASPNSTSRARKASVHESELKGSLRRAAETNKAAQSAAEILLAERRAAMASVELTTDQEDEDSYGPTSII